MRPKAFNLLKAFLDAPTKLVEPLAEVERLFPVAAIWNERLGFALIMAVRRFKRRCASIPNAPNPIYAQRVA